MGIIKNIIETTFTSKGSENVVADTNAVAKSGDHLSKSMTRQGQASANASRKFSAQAEGLGGLVAAYAGAAATTYALTAAYDALSKASQVENVIRGTNTLAATIGQQGPKILKHIQDITQGQLSLAEASQNANIALSAGFNTKQLEGLITVATKASRALGRDLTDSIQRLIRGGVKLEPELLDELGIFTRIIPATKAYARELGVSVNSLSQFQKRQAFVNAIIEEGNQKFSAINTTAPSAQKSLEQLRANISNLTTEFTQLIANALSPVAKFFSDDLGRSLVLFSGVIFLVFKKSTDIIGSFVSESSHKLLAFANEQVLNNERTKKSYVELTATVESYNKALLARGGVTGKKFTGIDKAETALLQGTGRFTTGSAALNKELTSVRNAFKEGAHLGPQEMQKALTILDAAIEGNVAAFGADTKALEKNTLAYQDAVLIRNAYTKSLAETTLLTKVVTKATGIFSTSLKVLGRVSSGILGAFNWVFIISSALDLLGVDIFGTLYKWLNKTTKESENFKAGIVGAFAAASGGAKQLETSLKLAGATAKDLDKVNDKVVGLYNSIRSSAEAAIVARKRLSETSSPRSALTGLASTLTGLRSEVKVLQDAQKQAEANGKTNTAVYKNTQKYIEQDLATIKKYEDIQKRTVTNADLLAVAVKRRADLESKIASDVKAGKSTSEDRQQLALINAAIATYKKYDATLIKIIGDLSAITGINTDKVAAIFGDKAAVSIDKATESLTIYGITLRKLASGEYDLSTLSKNQRSIVVDSISATSALKDTREAVDTGAISSSKLAAALGGVDSQFITIRKAAADYVKELISQGYSTDEAAKAAYASITALQKQRDSLQEVSDELSRLEAQYKAVSKLYSKDISAVTNAVFKGTVSVIQDGTKESIKFAQSQKEIYTNQNNQIRAILDNNKANFDLLKTINQEDKKHYTNLVAIQHSSELYSETLKAQAGRILEAGAAVAKLHREEEKRSKTLQNQLDILNQQNTVTLAKARSDLANTIAKNELAARESSLKLAKDELATDESRLKLALQQASYANKHLDELKKKGTKITSTLSKDAISNALPSLQDLALSINSKPLDKAIANLKTAFSKGSSKYSSIVDRQKAVANVELEARKAIQKEQLRQFDMETALQKDKIIADLANNSRQQALIKQQAEVDKARIDAQKVAIDSQTQTIQRQLDGYKVMASVVDGFGKHVKDLGEILSQYIKDTGGKTTIDTKTIVTNLQDQIGKQIASTQGLLTSNAEKQTAILDAQKKAVDNLSNVNLEKLKAQRESLLVKLASYDSQRIEQRKKLTIDQKTQVDKINNQIDTINNQIDKAKNKLYKTLQKLFDSIKSDIENAITSFNDLIFYGQGSFKDIMSNLFKSIQQDFFKQTIADPLSGSITGTLFNALGIKATRKGIDKAHVDSNGALLVTWMGSLLDGKTPGGKGDPSNIATGLKTSVKGFMTSLFGKDGIVGKLFNNLFGTGGFLASILHGFGGILRTIFSSLGFAAGGMIHKAAGGAIHMAQGGLLRSANALRDSIPAKLERGEFVIRKSSAQKIGAPALHALNANGRMPMGSGNIQVNVSNEGAPKEAQVSKPHFDGEKYVIDIVTRDLQNNGPIRRTLRGGAV